MALDPDELFTLETFTEIDRLWAELWSAGLVTRDLVERLWAHPAAGRRSTPTRDGRWRGPAPWPSTTDPIPPRETLRQLLDDDHPGLHDRGQRSGLLDDRETVAWLAQDPSPRVRAVAARAWSADEVTLRRLVQDPDLDVRTSAAGNPWCEPEHLRLAAALFDRPAASWSGQQDRAILAFTIARHRQADPALTRSLADRGAISPFHLADSSPACPLDLVLCELLAHADGPASLRAALTAALAAQDRPEFTGLATAALLAAVQTGDEDLITRAAISQSAPVEVLAAALDAYLARFHRKERPDIAVALCQNPATPTSFLLRLITARLLGQTQMTLADNPRISARVFTAALARHPDSEYADRWQVNLDHQRLRAARDPSSSTP